METHCLNCDSLAAKLEIADEKLKESNRLKNATWEELSHTQAAASIHADGHRKARQELSEALALAEKYKSKCEELRQDLICCGDIGDDRVRNHVAAALGSKDEGRVE